MNTLQHYDDFSDFVFDFLGKRVQVISWFASIAVIVGAAIIYHILMQESFYEIVKSFAGGSANGWSRPLAALIPALVFPLTNMRTLQKLVKFNSVGFLFLWYTIVFICYHGVQALIKNEVDWKATLPASESKIDQSSHTLQVVWGAQPTFGPLAGMMLLSFFIHNCIQPITKNASSQTKRRDIALAYVIFFRRRVAFSLGGGGVEMEPQTVMPAPDAFLLFATVMLLFNFCSYGLAGGCYTLIGTLGYLGYGDALKLKPQKSLTPNFLDMFGTDLHDSAYVHSGMLHGVH